MITRRRVVFTLGAGALVPFTTFAQAPSKIWRIGFLGMTNAAAYEKELAAIRENLNALGYMEGKNLTIEFRWAEGKFELLDKLAAELVALKVDVIITHSLPGARAAALATKTLPIVVADIVDPVAAGIAASLAHPGGNLTGSTSLQSDIQAKRLELLKEAVPRIRRVAQLSNAGNPGGTLIYRKSLEDAAKLIKAELQDFAVRTPADFAGAFKAMKKAHIDVAVIMEDSLLNTHARTIAAQALSHRIPTSGYTNFADAGGLLAYGANRVAVYGRAASFVDRILKGGNPADIPFERATKFELIVNMKTAKALGIKIPNTILVRADRVIE